MQYTKSHGYLLAAGLIALVAIGWFAYTFMYKTDMGDHFSREYDRATQLSSSGQQDEAINEFRRLIPLAPTAEEAAKLKILLAGNLFSRNAGSDRSEAVQLYLEVYADTAVPNQVRALSLNNIANNLQGQSETFYKLYFSQPPFSEFLPSTGSENYKITHAYRKILELSYQTYPTSFAVYALAGNYYAPALSLVPNIAVKKERLEGIMSDEEAAQKIQEHIAQGDALKDDNLHVPHVNVNKYLYRALALNTSGRVLNAPLAERESGFQKLMEYGVQYEGGKNERAEEMMLRARFYYADFLIRHFDEDRHERIANLLQPFGQAATGSDHSSVQAREYFAGRMAASTNNIIKERSAQLGEVSPEFKSFLAAINAPRAE